MDHKLHLTDRVDTGTGQVNVEVRGCLTQDNYPDLLTNLRGAARIAGTGSLVLNLSGANHLDPDVLLALRALSAPGPHDATGHNGKPGANVALPVTLVEPAELPICLMHVGADGEVLAQLDAGPGAHAGGCVFSEHAGDPAIIDVAAFYEGTLDPGSTVRALSDHALEQLTDALYRHLDSPAPSFAAQTWFELATEEAQNRRDRQPIATTGSPAGQATSGREEVSPV